jgi:amino acid permease
MKIKKFVQAVSVLSSTIIGVGLFSLPYITLKVGFWTVLVYFFILGGLCLFVHLIFGEISLLAPDFKRLPGFVKFFLGERAEKFIIISTTLGLWGVILAYLIVGGEFLNNLFFPYLNKFLTQEQSYFLFTIIYFLLGAFLIFFGIRTIAFVEFWGLILFFLVLVLIFLKGRTLINLNYLFLGKLSFENWFLPYGPILFSLWGASLIPEIEEMLKEEKKELKKVIFVSLLIPFFVYLFFIFTILGISGKNTSPSAIGGLNGLLPPYILNLTYFFGFLTTFTSFITLGLTLLRIFSYDLNLKKETSFILACFLPLILFLLGFKNFIKVISVVGGVMLGIDAIFIILIYQKLKNKKYISLPLFFVFLFGIIYEIFSLF